MKMYRHLRFARSGGYRCCLPDAARNSDDPGRDTLLERITSRHGEKIIDDAVRLGYGSADYELIEV